MQCPTNQGEDLTDEVEDTESDDTESTDSDPDTSQSSQDSTSAQEEDLEEEENILTNMENDATINRTQILTDLLATLRRSR